MSPGVSRAQDEVRRELGNLNRYPRTTILLHAFDDLGHDILRPEFLRVIMLALEYCARKVEQDVCLPLHLVLRVLEELNTALIDEK